MSLNNNHIAPSNLPPSNNFPNAAISLPSTNYSNTIESSSNHDFNRNPHFRTSPNSYPSSVIHKFNLVFDGSKGRINIERFVVNIYGIPEFRLLNDIKQLLEEKSLNRYMIHKELNRPESFFEFRTSMVHHF